MTKQRVTRIGWIALSVASAFAGGAAMNRDAFAHGHGEEGVKEFSVADFHGNYGMLEVGEAEGLPLVEVAQVRADGVGTITIEATVNLGGELGFTDTLSCPYSVRPNGMGHMDCHSDTTGESTSADFVLTDGGREVKIITAPNPAGYTHSVARRQ